MGTHTQPPTAHPKRLLLAHASLRPSFPPVIPVVRFLSAVRSSRSVEETEILAGTNPDPGTKTQSRILAVFSHVLLMLHRRCNPVEAAKALSQGKVQPSLARLAAMVSLPPRFFT